MPLYEYTCRDCGRSFEFLTRDGRSPACPGCGGETLDKVFSTFAVSVPSGPSHAHAAPPACGGCPSAGAPGGCHWGAN